MSYGLIVYLSDGVTAAFDSRSAMGGVFLGVVNLAIGSSGTIVYDGVDVAGRTLRVQITAAGSHTFTTGSSGSQPKLTYTAVSGHPSPRPTSLIIWAE